MATRFDALRSEPVNQLDAAARGAHDEPRTELEPFRPLPTGSPIGTEADVLLIVPPFASIWYPSLGAHVLQACVRERGITLDVLYANLLLAGVVGEASYEKITAESISLGAERFFARSAFGLPPLGHGADDAFEPARIYGREQAELCQGLYPDGKAATLGRAAALTVEEFRRLESISDAWVCQLADRIAARPYRIVGATTTFQQTTASIALLNRIKLLRPDIVTVLGGANCEGRMAEGLLGLGTSIDYFFSGESEATFPQFVEQVLAGQRPVTPIIVGRPCQDLDALPMLSSKEFFAQRGEFLRSRVPLSSTLISFETSRGCWWGQKQHCTFCGLNGEGMGFRRKSPDRAIRELRALLDESPTRNISMADNIMPHEYFQSFVPHLPDSLPGVSIFYEQKANLSLQDMLALKRGGITIIQPGIEALSTGLLKLMRKGVNGRQNLMLLRYGRVCGIQLVWNLICGFPNDSVGLYRETMELVRLIPHLEPPNGMFHLSIERFSPYFERPEAHGITNVRPLPVYQDFFPEGADLHAIAYHFIGDYVSETHSSIDLVRRLNHDVQAWLAAWRVPYARRPELKICRDAAGLALIDTRQLPESIELRALSHSEAVSLLSARPFRDSPEERDALAARLAVVADGWFVPLVIAEQDLFCELTTEHRKVVTQDQQRLRQLPVLVQGRVQRGDASESSRVPTRSSE
jgi:ribosomal peptide maturation radical SAM protein 1